MKKKGYIVLKSIDENNLSSATFEYADNKKGDAEVISLDEFIIKEKIKKCRFS